jgi:hypothetical protein
MRVLFPEVVPYGTLGSCLDDAMHAGNVDVAACLPAPRASALLPLFWFTCGFHGFPLTSTILVGHEIYVSSPLFPVRAHVVILVII